MPAVRDLGMAAGFYEKTLRLTPVDMQPGTAVTYRRGDTTLWVNQSELRRLLASGLLAFSSRGTR
jgi:hypothetical protein